MNTSQSQAEQEAGARRFSLAVWPQTAARRWHAEVSNVGSFEPLRFDRPIDLLLYLTEFPGTSSPHPRGLR